MSSSSSTSVGRRPLSNALRASSAGWRNKAIPRKHAAKKMTIKLKKKKPKLSAEYEDSAWANLKTAIVAINTRRSTKGLSYEELYRSVENLCIHKKSAKLYERLRSICECYVEKKIIGLVDQTPDHQAFLSLVNNSWQNHCEQTRLVRNIFMYLDRTFVIENGHCANQAVRSVWDSGLYFFRRHLLSRPDLQNKILQGSLHLIERERVGDMVDRSLLSNILSMYWDIGIYVDIFEKEFLRLTAVFYSVEASRVFLEMDVKDYLIHIEKRIHEENLRVIHYLNNRTRIALINVLEEEFISRYIPAILEKGFDTLMACGDKGTPDLKRMFQLFGRVDAYPRLQASLSNYIQVTGKAIVNDHAKDKEMINLLISLKASVDLVLEKCFDNERNFADTKQDAFQAVVNCRPRRPAELIAKFIDRRLRSGNKIGSEEEIRESLKHVMVLFRYVSSKDIFEAFYKKDLAKRLLLNKSISDDMERHMVSKLKNECGRVYTNKMEGMFKDMDVSKDIMNAFRSSDIGKEKLKGGVINVYVHILTTGFWPSYPDIPCKIPESISSYIKAFETFYLNKYNGRQLSWQHGLAHCVLKAKFPKGSRELVVSQQQAIVLLYFNENERARASEIKRATGMNPDTLRRTLNSLSLGQFRVLVRKKNKENDKEKPSSNESSKDRDPIFAFNSKFTARLFRLRLNNIQIKTTKKEQIDTNSRIARDRQYQIDAVIVRVMKTRKSLQHSSLIVECMKQLKFPAEAVALKKRIESLIDREYMERDSETSSLYHYMA